MPSSSALTETLRVNISHDSNMIALADHGFQNELLVDLASSRGEILGQLPGQLLHGEVKVLLLLGSLPGLLVRLPHVAEKLFQEVASLPKLRSVKIYLRNRMPKHDFFLRLVREYLFPLLGGNYSMEKYHDSSDQYTYYLLESNSFKLELKCFGFSCKRYDSMKKVDLQKLSSLWKIDAALTKECITVSNKLTNVKISTEVKPSVMKTICSATNLISLDLSCREFVCLEPLIRALTPIQGLTTGKRKRNDTGAPLAHLNKLRIGSMIISLQNFTCLCQALDSHESITELNIDSPFVKDPTAEDGFVHLTAAELWEPLLQLLRHNTSLMSVAFHPIYLASSSWCAEMVSFIFEEEENPICQQIHDVLYSKNGTVGTLSLVMEGTILPQRIEELLSLNHFGFGQFVGTKLPATKNQGAFREAMEKFGCKMRDERNRAKTRRQEHVTEVRFVRTLFCLFQHDPSLVGSFL
ncbi:expressed unknown protein [Seminavis robusta]|uniref:Uncharacterized protein n=1 Tax=Seminavis robusta TaxID=568900 RepID=A0A9N8H6H4_9STRA|nr:expressed unknown protein [Seminavis robusta]|eukprot:Sro171_g075760.1 n/a (467) ;mRNA; f:43495-44895